MLFCILQAGHSRFHGTRPYVRNLKYGIFYKSKLEVIKMLSFDRKFYAVSIHILHVVVSVNIEVDILSSMFIIFFLPRLSG